MINAGNTKCKLKKVGFQLTFKINWMINSAANAFKGFIDDSLVRKMEKHNIIVNHAAPKTQPGGTHGA